MAAELLAAEADVSLSFTTDQAKGEWVYVRFTLSSLVGVVKLVATLGATTVETTLPGNLPPASRVFVPAGWTIHFGFVSWTSGSVQVEIVPTVEAPPAPLFFFRNQDMVLLTDAVAGVITDLGADVAGNSVAQAITDLEAAIGV